MITPRIGLSEKWRLPVLVVAGWQFNPWNFIRMWLVMRDWSYRQSLFRHHDGTILELDRYYAGLLLSEWKMWPAEYGGDFSGMSVLDAGGGEGETAAFFMERGARKVYIVERNHHACGVIRRNIARNGWNAVVLEEPFSADHLSLPVDYAKIDVEGGEKELLRLPRLPCPVRIEVHSSDVERSLCLKFGLRTIREARPPSPSMIG